MQPSDVAGVHHAPEPPIRVNDEVLAFPILAGACASRTATNDGSILQPPRHRQFPNVQAHSTAFRDNLGQPGATSFLRLPRSKPLRLWQFPGSGATGATFCQLLLYREESDFSPRACVRLSKRLPRLPQFFTNHCKCGTTSGATSVFRLSQVAPGCPKPTLERFIGTFPFPAIVLGTAAGLEDDALKAALAASSAFPVHMFTRASPVDLDHQVLRLHFEGPL